MIWLVVTSLLIVPASIAEPYQNVGAQVSGTLVVDQGLFGTVGFIEKDSLGIVKVAEEQTTLFAPGDISCCANPLISDTAFGTQYCGELSSDECCPSTGMNYGSSQFAPTSQADCLANYWEGQACENSARFNPGDINGLCYEGCCYDASDGLCDVSKSQGACLVSNPSNIWAEGFGSPTPCVSSGGVVAIPECFGGGQSCGDFSGNTNNCKNQGCWWCDNGANSHCTSSCFSCGNYIDHRVEDQQCVLPGGDNECTNANDDDSDNFIDSQDICCAVGGTEENCLCPDEHVMLLETEECTDVGGGNPVTSHNGLPGAGVGCCSQPVRNVPACPLGNRSNITLLDGDANGNGKYQGWNVSVFTGDYCQCNIETPFPQFVDLRDSQHANYNRYCCSGGFSDVSCQTGTIRGRVKDHLGVVIESVLINVTGTESGVSTIGYSDGSGQFSLSGLNYEQYSINISKPGYQDSFELKNLQTPDLDLGDVTLYPAPLTSGPCIDQWPLPELSVTSEKCKKHLVLNWNYDCTDNLSSQGSYILWRSTQQGSIGFPIATFDRGETDHIDLISDGNIETPYYYTLQVVPALPGYFNFQDKSGQETNYAGDEICFSDLNCEDEEPQSITQFCADSGQSGEIISCGFDNRLRISDYCNNGVNCYQQGNSINCPNPNPGCSDIGMDKTPQNIFGLYYFDHKTECTTDHAAECYFDYSDTSVDVCRDCKPSEGDSVDTCYDYRSEDACSGTASDNCLVAIDTEEGCAWFSGDEYYGEFGEGVCYDAHYNETDQCSRCSSELGPDGSSGIFANTDCAPTLCEKLGPCYSKDEENYCESCVRYPDADFTNATGCYDLEDEYSCEGNGAYDIPIFNVNGYTYVEGSYHHDTGARYIDYGYVWGSSVDVDDLEYWHAFGFDSNEGSLDLQILRFVNTSTATIYTGNTAGFYQQDEFVVTVSDTSFSLQNEEVSLMISHLVAINDHPSQMNIGLSESACDLGVCTWKSASGCIKDANDNDIDDCVEFSGNNQLVDACKRDSFPPETEVNFVQPHINLEGGIFEFFIEDYGWGDEGLKPFITGETYDVYYCFTDEEETCVPHAKLEGYTEGEALIQLGDHPYLVGREQASKLSYYAVDGFGNVEPIKEVFPVTVDTLAPQIAIEGIILDEERCDANITISVSEPSNCSMAFSEILNPTVENILDTYTFEFRDLNDQKYQSKIVCNDLYNNTETLLEDVHIDCDHLLNSVTPEFGTVYKAEENIPNTILVEANLTAQPGLDSFYRCTVDVNGTLESMGPPEYSTGIEYQIWDIALQSEKYDQEVELNVSCENGLNGEEHLDDKLAFYYLDTTPPESNLEYLDRSNNQWVPLLENTTVEKLKVRAHCEGDEIWHVDNDCTTTYLCDEAGGGVCLDQDYTALGEPVEFFLSRQLCWYSEDAVGNTEERECIYITVDDTAPEVTIIYPEDGLVLEGTPTITVNGTANGGQSLVQNVTLLWPGISNPASIQANSIPLGGNYAVWEGVEPLLLRSGKNIIYAHAEDELGQLGADSIIIYADDIGPRIENIQVDVALTPEGEYITEYTVPFRIYAFVNDSQYTALDPSTHNNTLRLKPHPITLEFDDPSSLSCSEQYFTNLTEDATDFELEVFQNVSCFRPGLYHLELIAEDRIGNSHSKNISIRFNDSSEPLFQFVSLIPHGSSPLYYDEDTARTFIGYGSYNLTINATEPLAEDPLANLSWYNNGEKIILLDLIDQQDENYIYNLTTYGNANFSGLDQIGIQLHVSGQDRRGINGTYSTYSFYVDTRGPLAPILTSHDLTLPLILNTLSEDIYGHVLENGIRANGYPVYLQRTNGSGFKSTTSADQIEPFSQFPPDLLDPNYKILSVSDNTLVVRSIFSGGLSFQNLGIIQGNYLGVDAFQDDVFYEITQDPTPLGENLYTLTVDRPIALQYPPNVIQIYTDRLNQGAFLFEDETLHIGRNKFEVWSTDRLQNEGAHIFFDLVIDNEAPTFSTPFAYPPPNTVFCNENTGISIEANGTYSDISYCSMQISSDSGGSPSCSCLVEQIGSELANLSCNPGVFSDGNYTVEVTAEDQAGNTDSTEWSFTIDSQAPCISNFYPAPNQYINDSTPGVVLEFRDILSNKPETNLVNVTIFRNSDILKSIPLTQALETSGTTQQDIEYYAYELNDQINPSENLTIDGAWYFNITAERIIYVDNVPKPGNNFSTLYAFFLDTLPPELINQYPEGFVNTNNENVTVQLTTDEKSSCRWGALQDGGTQSYYAFPEDQSFSTFGGIEHFANVSVNAIEDTQTYYFACVDLAGNYNLPPNNQLIVRYDQTGPEIVMDPLPAYTNASTLTVSGRILSPETEIGSRIEFRTDTTPSAAPYYFANTTENIVYFDSVQGYSVGSLSLGIGQRLTLINADLDETITVSLEGANWFEDRILSPGQQATYQATSIDGPVTLKSITENGTNVLLSVNVTNQFSREVFLFQNAEQLIKTVPYDSLENKGLTQQQTVFQDSQPPAIIGSYPSISETINDLNPTLELFVEDNYQLDIEYLNFSIEGGEISDAYVSLNDVECTAEFNRCTYRFITSTLEEDTDYLFNFELFDVAGNSMSQSIPFSIDTEIPSVALSVTPSIHQPYTSSPSPNLTLSFNYPIDVDTLSISDGRFEIVPSFSTTEFIFRTRNGESFEDGNYPITIQAQRQNGLGLVLSTTELFIVDTLAPEIAHTYFTPITHQEEDGLYITNQSLATYFAQIDDLSLDTVLINGVEPLFDAPYYKANIILPENVETQVVLEAIDLAGNNNSVEATIIYDSVAPYLAIINPIEGNLFDTSQVEVEGQVRDDHLVSPITLEGDLTSWVSVSVDPSDTALQNFDASVELSQEGIRRISGKSEDYAGHVSYDFVDVLVDISGPKLVSTVPGDLALLGDLTNYTLFFEKQIYESAIDFSTLDVEITPDLDFTLVNNGEDQASILFSQGIAGGQGPSLQTYSLEISLEDVLGNENSYARSFTIDKNAPLVSWVYPAQQIITNSAEQYIELQASARQGTIDSILVNNGEQIDDLSGTLFNTSFTLLSEGIHLYSVQVIDSLGNQWNDQQHFILDTTLPELWIDTSTYLSKASGELYVLNATTFIQGSVSDEVGLEKVEVLVDGVIQSTDALVSSDSYRADLDLGNLAGEHTLLVRAIDLAGNSVEESITLLLDNEEPAFVDITFESVSVIDGLNKTNLSYVDLQGSFTEKEITSIYALTHAFENVIINNAENTFTMRIYSTTGFGEISNEVVLELLDDSGRTAQSDILTFIYDQQGPGITLTAPENAATELTQPTISIQLNETAHTQEGCTLNYTWYLSGPVLATEDFSAVDSQHYEIVPNRSLASGESHLITPYCFDTFNNLGVASFLLYVESNNAEINTPKITQVNPLQGIPTQGTLPSYVLAQEVSPDTSATVFRVFAEDDDIEGLECRYGLETEYDLMLGSMGVEQTITLSEITQTISVSPIETYTDGTTQLINFACRDRVGKTSELYTLNLTVDLFYPVALLDFGPKNGTNNVQPTLFVQTDADAICELDGEGADNVVMTKTSAPQGYNHTYTLLSPLNGEGSYSYDVVCEAQNRESAELSFDVVVDLTAPTKPRIIPPTPTVTNSAFNVYGATDEVGLTIIPLVNGIEYGPQYYTTTGSQNEFVILNLPLTYFDEGPNELQVKAIDPAGNSNISDAYVVTASNTIGPEITIIPNDQSTLREVQEILVEIQQNRDVSVAIDQTSFLVSVFKEGIPVSFTLNDSNLSSQGGLIIVETGPLSDGIYTVTASINNTVDVQTEAVSTFSIDSRCPQLSFTVGNSYESVGLQTWLTNQLSATFNVSVDTQRPITNVIAGYQNTNSSLGSLTTLVYSNSLQSEGFNVFTFWAQNDLGLTCGGNTLAFERDTTAPDHRMTIDNVEATRIG